MVGTSPSAPVFARLRNDSRNSTLEVSPIHARDLLKDLYQGLLPRAVRHALGQYFTPDWLAETLLDGAGYHGEVATRLVDPSCGTGTFLVLALTRLRETLRKRGVADAEALAAVLGNVVGFDIDPLAVVASRTNYVLALGPLLRVVPKHGVDIPVYLADSIVMPASGETLFSEGRLALDTAGGTFSLPACIDTEQELRDVCDLASRGIEEHWDSDVFVRRAGRACGATAAERRILADFYAECLDQHLQGIDGLWPLMLRNAFMPAFVEPFDLVIGNPPWVNWEHLPTTYRERTRPIWEASGLFVHGGMQAMLGSGKKDVAMLMSYVATDKLLKPGGRLAFVVTQTLFKTAGAGQGFRRFRIGDGGPDFRVESVDDMVDLNPFVGASNRTALVTWTRDAKTTYPVDYRLWQRTAPRGIPADAPRDAVLAVTEQLLLAAAPVHDDDPTSAWLTAPPPLVPALRKLAETGDAHYRAHAGVYAGLNGVYWLSVTGPPGADGRVPVTNLHDIGTTRLRKEYGLVESELIHPLVRGRDIERWLARASVSLLFVQDVDARRGIDHATMADKYPGALAFLESFEPDLRARRGLPAALRRGEWPFWSMLGVGDYTLAEHKVVWRDQAADFAAAVMPRGAPLPFPNHKAMMVACESADEAHYLCGVVNSLPVRTFVASYVVETQISTHLVRYVHIPKFDQENPEHRSLRDAAQNAHAAVSRGDKPDEDTVDRAAGALWGLTFEDLAGMRDYLDRLQKRHESPTLGEVATASDD